MENKVDSTSRRQLFPQQRTTNVTTELHDPTSHDEIGRLVFFLVEGSGDRFHGTTTHPERHGRHGTCQSKNTFLSQPLMEKTTSQRCCFGYAATATVDVPLCRSIGLFMEKTDLPITYFL